nr:hypothetical protein [uncultured Cohaesibacter sp.]
MSHYSIVGSFFLAMTLGVFVFASSPRASGEKVVVFVPPWSEQTDAIDVIARAGGAFVGTGNRSWIAIGISNHPHFVRDLYRAGALYVGSGTAFSACFPAELLRTVASHVIHDGPRAKPAAQTQYGPNKVETS